MVDGYRVIQILVMHLFKRYVRHTDEKLHTHHSWLMMTLNLRCSVFNCVIERHHCITGRVTDGIFGASWNIMERFLCKQCQEFSSVRVIVTIRIRNAKNTSQNTF